MEWTVEDIDRTEDDCLIEKVGDCLIYLIDDFDVTGYGVLKNGEYFVRTFFINSLSSEELNKLSDDLLIESRRFALGISPNQLSLF